MNNLIKAIKRNTRTIGRQLKIVEVCGTHTTAIHRHGLPSLFAGEIDFISGPGCPVCVTAGAFIDQLAALSAECTVYSFGDMLRVPGINCSLAEARAEGGDVRIMVSPPDAVAKAAQSGKQSVIAAIGFETTAPAFALAAEACITGKIDNVRFLTELKTIPEPLKFLLQSGPEFDGIFLPGHVAAVIGSRGFEFVDAYGIPSVITGFDANDVLQGLLLLTEAILTKHSQVQNQYTRVVRTEGNRLAQAIVAKYYEPADTYLRGIGLLPGAGLAFREQYRFLEYPSRVAALPAEEDQGCRCGEVLLGRIKPYECPLFRVVCRPDRPRGACMVSTEGSCAAYFRYGGGSGHENHQGAR